MSSASAHVGLDSVTLTWSSTHATSCAASGAWTGEKPPEGSLTLLPDSVGTLTYGLSCTGPGGVSAQRTAPLSTSVYTRTTCANEHTERFWQKGPAAPVLMGELLTVNSVGYLEDPVFQAKNHLQACMTSTSRRAGTITVSSTWSSTAPPDTVNGEIFGYQSVGWGSTQFWNAGQTTTRLLPAAVSALPDSLRVSFSGTTVAPNSHYNTLLILNTTPSATPDNCHMGEIDIQFDIKGNTLWYGDSTVHTLGGTEYLNIVPMQYVTKRPSPMCPNDPTSYYQYVQMWVRPFSSAGGSVLVKPVLQWLIDRGALPPTTNLMTIWFGTEIGYGSGSADFTYSIRPR